MTVSLRAMIEQEFAVFREISVTEYATDVASARGIPIGEARGAAQVEFDQRLPDGAQTAGHRAMVVLDEDRVVGRLWIGQHPDDPTTGFIWEVEIDEGERGRGLGTATMIAAEELAREAGWTEVGLSVFGFNESAQRLYSSLGYTVVSTRMSKKIEPF